jgi:hypothetical protein
LQNFLGDQCATEFIFARFDCTAALFTACFFQTVPTALPFLVGFAPDEAVDAGKLRLFSEGFKGGLSPLRREPHCCTAQVFARVLFYAQFDANFNVVYPINAVIFGFVFFKMALRSILPDWLSARWIASS